MKSLPLYLIVLVFAACNKSDYVPVKGSGSGTKNKIIGNVVLYDDLTYKAPPYNGMTVRIEGTSFSAVTDSSGKYSFKDVPLGTYTVLYEKPGYGTYKLDTFNLVENLTDTPTIIEPKTLGQLSTTSVTDMLVSIDGDYIKVETNIDPTATDSSARGIRFFYAKDSLVTKEKFSAFSIVYPTKSATVTERIAKTDFYSMGFSAGDTVYIKAYGDAFFSNDYIDVPTAKRIFPNINPNSVSPKSFILP